MDNQDLIKIGFKEIQHFTIGNSVTYDLGRGRHLSATSVGTPNEMVWLCSADEPDQEVTDLICLHNYDYDYFLTLERINKIISALEPLDKNNPHYKKVFDNSHSNKTSILHKR